jgi:hypothetical protein
MPQSNGTKRSEECRVATLSPATASAAATPTISTIPASASALWPGARLIDIQFTASYLAPVQRSDRLFSFLGVGHLHESKTAGPACVPVRHDTDPVHLPMRLKKLTQLFFRSIEVQISNKDVLQASASM